MSHNTSYYLIEVVTKAGLTVELNLLYFYFFLAANSVNNIKSTIGDLQERTCIRFIDANSDEAKALPHNSVVHFVDGA